MMKDYDQICEDCEGCYWMRFDSYPSGERYAACRWFGYILHPQKGISSEPCTSRMNASQGSAYMKRQNEAKEKRKGR